jgi:hypothetical protein
LPWALWPVFLFRSLRGDFSKAGMPEARMSAQNFVVLPTFRSCLGNQNLIHY